MENERRLDLVSPQIVELGIAMSGEMGKFEATNYMRRFLISPEIIDRVLRQPPQNHRKGRTIPGVTLFNAPGSAV